MPRLLIGALVLGLLAAPARAQQATGVVGDWRGTLTSAQGTESPFVLTIVQSSDGFVGTTSGLGSTFEVRLRSVTVSGSQVSFAAESESSLGTVELSGELTADGNRLSGAGALAVGGQRFAVNYDLQRRPRRTVTQPQVEQTIAYFVGRWQFEYVGAEYPPLSVGTRKGTATFARLGESSFAHGQVTGDVFGEAYEESIAVGYDSDSDAVAWVDRRPGGVELMSVGDWSSPLAITFKTAPIQSDGHTYQLRRVISVRSETAFDVTEEFSIDGGSFKRLGNGSYTKQN